MSDYDGVTEEDIEKAYRDMAEESDDWGPLERRRERLRREGRLDPWED